MIKYEINRSINIPNAAGLAIFEPSDAGVAMGGIVKPGTTETAWDMLIDPDYLVAPDGIRNVAAAQSVMVTADGTFHSASTFTGGQTAIDVANISGRRVFSNFSINPSEWTFFCVIESDITNAAGGIDLMRPEDTDLTGLGPHVGLSSTGEFRIYGSSTSNIRLESPEVIPQEQATLLMATFSETDGLRLFVDGIQVAADATRRSPLDEATDAGEFNFWRKDSGSDVCLLGMTGVLSIDLGRSRNEPYRRAVTTFLKTKYGIS